MTDDLFGDLALDVVPGNGVAVEAVSPEYVSATETGEPQVRDLAGGWMPVAEMSVDDLVGYHALVDAHRAGMYQARQFVDDELIRRMDRDNEHTKRAGRLKASAPRASVAVSYDGERLRGLLDVLVDDGVISRKAVSDAIEEQVEVRYKVHAGKINGLVAMGGAVADAVAAARIEEPKERRVSVKPS